jgi:sugar lactone lactonase YvrE
MKSLPVVLFLFVLTRVGLRALAATLLAGAAVLMGGTPTAVAAPNCPGGQIKPVTLANTGDVLEYGLLDAHGHFFYSDQSKGALMEIDGFGSPPRQVAAINGPGGIVAESDGSLIVGSGDGISNGVFGDAFPMASLVRVDPATGNVSTFASGLGMANGVAQAADGTLYATNDFGFDIDRIDTTGHVDHGWAKVFSTNGVVVSRDQRYVYVSQTFAPAAVQRITIADPSQVSTFAAAQGTDIAAGPDDMTMDVHGNLYLTVNGAGQVWRIAPDRSICVLASGLQNPSAAVLGPGSLASNLYVVGFGGEIVELPGAAAVPSA